MDIGVRAGQLVGLGLGEELDSLVGLEVVLHPEAFAARVHPHVGVRAEAVHVPVRLRDAAVAHQPGDLVCRLRAQRPEVPLHVVVAQARAGQALLRADEVRELDRVLDEEDRRVVADQVVVALFGVELQREAARVAPGVRAALLAGDGGEAREDLGLLARLQEVGAGVAADVLGDHEFAERARALGVHHALRHALAVELRELLDEVVVVQQDRSAGALRQRVVVAAGRCAGIRRGDRALLSHCLTSRFSNSCTAVCADTPEDDLRLVDREPAEIGRIQARRRADDAIHIRDRAAPAAHEVMMVVADARLEDRR